MIDRFGRRIDYMRISVTDRCNLRCRYCMPEGIQLARHGDVLRFEEILRLCKIAVSLGIVKFKITGGEPLARRGCLDFIGELKGMAGVEQVTLTTNGLLLRENLAALSAVDGVNVSLDTLRADRFNKLIGREGYRVEQILDTIRACVQRGLRTKVNAVLLAETFDEIPQLAALAGDMPTDVRFIELMPIGMGAAEEGVSMEKALAALGETWPDLRRVNERRGNGPARYYASDALRGRIGFISAISRQFCQDCNRVRLTATGVLKPCLCYEEGVDIKTPLRAGGSDEELRRAMAACIDNKPQAHCFSQVENMTEARAMVQIGG